MNKNRLSALVAAGLLSGGLMATSASAADLGGNCCADLEERIAELEATTARKGNRKVSLTISGWVAEQVTYWDDGHESNVYVTGIGKTLASHFKFTGEAKITPGWSAGYVLHVEANAADSSDINRNNDDAGNAIALLQSYWFVKSEQLGKLSVGQLSHASDNTAILVDGSGSLVPANWVHFDGLSFTPNNGGLAGAWANLAYCKAISAGFAGDCNGYPNNAVRYDTPTFAGFSLSASWGEDDFWDVAARYAGEFGGFKLAAAVAYHETSEEKVLLGQLGLGVDASLVRRDSAYIQAGLYIQHVPTGLFVYGAYGAEFDDSTYQNPVVQANLTDGEKWYVKAGIRQRWSPLGHTVLYGEYSQNNDLFTPGMAAAGVTGSELNQWGVGVVQEVDAAAMSFWLAYRNLEGDYSGVGVVNPNMDDLHIVKAGALISF
ncbi:MAG: porin [Pseudomonadota bacterium]